MQLADHLNTLLHNRLAQRRIVVRYDGEQAFGDFVVTLRMPQTQVATAGASAVTARRATDALALWVDWHRPVSSKGCTARSGARADRC